MKKLNHNNILKLHEVFEDTERLFLIIDVHNGGSLEDYIKQNQKIDKQSIQIIMNQLLQGIKHMHEQGIMHRDLKPDNILLKKANDINHIIIADFGLSTEINVKDFIFNKVGTPGYIAPEIFKYSKSNIYNEKCDVFSLGSIFHSLVFGYHPFVNLGYQNIPVIDRNAYGVINFEQKQYNNYDKMAIDLMRRMLQKDALIRSSLQQVLRHPYLKMSDISQQKIQIVSNYQDISEHEIIEDEKSINQISVSPQKGRQKYSDYTNKNKQKAVEDEYILINQPQDHNSFILGRSCVLKGNDLNSFVLQNSSQIQNSIALTIYNNPTSTQSINNQNSRQLDTVLSTRENSSTGTYQLSNGTCKMDYKQTQKEELRPKNMTDINSKNLYDNSDQLNLMDGNTQFNQIYKNKQIDCIIYQKQNNRNQQNQHLSPVQVKSISRFGKQQQQKQDQFIFDSDYQ